MPKFGSRSQQKLSECHLDIQRVLNEAIKYMDFTILTGHRNKVDQDEAFATGRSQLRFPQSKHNKAPSWAVDIAPWPIDWNDRERFILLAGLVLGIGRMMGVNLRWGGDWNMNWSIKDESFFDLPHFELVA